MLVSAVLLLFISLSLNVAFGQKPPSDAAPLNHELELTDEEEVIALWMPKINTTKEDQYFCMGKNVDFDIRYIVKYVPHASAKSVHHILIYGCSEPIKSTSDTGAWSCLDDHPIQGACTGRSKFLFAWAKDAPTFQLPKDVGFQLGRKTDVKGIFIQIHYSALVTNDDSGFSLVYTSEPRKYAAGIFLLAAGGQFIPPREPVVNVNVLCRYNDDTVIHPFGFRTHAHGLGVVISGWYMKQEDEAKLEWTMLGKQSPQNPQAFYPMPAAHNITKGTLLGARCVYNSTERSAITFMGPTHNDEMCNFYMMYYADRSIVHDSCGDVGQDVGMYQLPKEASIPLPASEIKHHHGQHGKPAVTPVIPATPAAPGAEVTVPPPAGEEHHGHEMPTVPPPGHGREGELGETNEVPPEMATEESVVGGHDHEMSGHDHGDMEHGEHGGAVLPTPAYEEDENWSSTVSKMNLGQISGVALGPTEKHVYIFHRNDHVWDGGTFDANNNYARKDAGPIAQPTIAILDAASGKLQKHIGQKMFYMPHGITVDAGRNIWVTDVALHQVFKLSPDGQATMILGKQFQSGHDGQHFCKPSMVAVLSSGDFFVADGYCNSRVIRFNSNGNYVSHFGTDTYNPFGTISPQPHEFFIPHDIKLSTDEKTIFVADRENGRVQAFDVATKKFLRLYQPAEFGSRLFALDLSGDLMVAVNGQVGMTVFGPEPPVSTILVNVSTGNTVGVLKSKASPLANPHAVVVSKDRSCIYVVELNSHAHKFHLPAAVLPPVPAAPVEEPSEHGHHSHGHDMEPITKPGDASGFSFIVLMLIIVPTLIVLSGGVYFCVKQWKTSSNQSKWKELLYQYGHSVKNPMDLGGYKARKEGFRPLRQNEAAAGESSDSEDEAFAAPRYSRNALV
ncbi:peptidyl-glycine alpha-amidating monooxygenase-like [Paramacrobiotus metropolitanus]|uniref:peptidyl-glycine alpha-amidating monooxygenase-like n=1 Tax=Paramacrobiotus metropolitanus TaxID=2943436 RepID=UPI0024456036|nr:peptidyl-glycine alpha-amidating monooxygenase-like [Paramacrobiotus metropolitanus]